MKHKFATILISAAMILLSLNGICSELIKKSYIFSSKRVEIDKVELDEDYDDASGIGYQLLFYDNPSFSGLCHSVVSSFLTKESPTDKEFLRIIGEKNTYRTFSSFHKSKVSSQCEYLPYKESFSADILISPKEVSDVRKIFNLKSEFVQVLPQYNLNFDKNQYFKTTLGLLKYSDLSHIGLMSGGKTLGITFRPRNSRIKSITFMTSRHNPLESEISVSHMYYPQRKK